MVKVIPSAKVKFSFHFWNQQQKWTSKISNQNKNESLSMFWSTSPVLTHSRTTRRSLVLITTLQSIYYLRIRFAVINTGNQFYCYYDFWLDDILPSHHGYWRILVDLRVVWHTSNQKIHIAFTGWIYGWIVITHANVLGMSSWHLRYNPPAALGALL